MCVYVNQEYLDHVCICQSGISIMCVYVNQEYLDHVCICQSVEH